MKWTPKQATCRDIQHSWAPYTARKTNTRPLRYVRVLRCTRCSAKKEQVLDGQGFILRTRMRYPAGYLRPPGNGRLTREDRARLRIRNVNLDN